MSLAEGEKKKLLAELASKEEVQRKEKEKEEKLIKKI